MLVPRIKAENPNTNTSPPTLFSLRDHVSGRTRSGLIVLAFAVGVVMLIVCANLSNLLLARATTRQKEMAIRAALGAGRRRLVRQMLTESVVLSVSGAVLGLVLAVVGTRAIAHMDAVSLPLLGNVGVDASALGFTALLAVAAGIAFGMAPALQISEARVHEALKASGRSATDGRRGQWLRGSLGRLGDRAGVRASRRLGTADSKFPQGARRGPRFPSRTPDRACASIRIENRFTSPQQFLAICRRSRCASPGRMPGVTSATIADGLPLGTNRSWGISGGGQEYVKGRVAGRVHSHLDGWLRRDDGNDVSWRDATSRHRTWRRARRSS